VRVFCYEPVEVKVESDGLHFIRQGESWVVIPDALNQTNHEEHVR